MKKGDRVDVVVTPHFCGMNPYITRCIAMELLTTLRTRQHAEVTGAWLIQAKRREMRGSRASEDQEAFVAKEK